MLLPGLYCSQASVGVQMGMCSSPEQGTAVFPVLGRRAPGAKYTPATEPNPRSHTNAGPLERLQRADGVARICLTKCRCL